MKLTRDVEYALMSMVSLKNSNRALSAREICESTHGSETLLPKVLQRLARAGLVESRQGSGGGYQLTDSTLSRPISDVVRAVHGPTGVVDCELGSCGMSDTCLIRHNMHNVQSLWDSLLDGVRIGDFVESGNKINVLRKPGVDAHADAGSGA